jgi:hypothetical protein
MDNKWSNGKVVFELPHSLHRLLAAIGIKPIALILDETIGPEIVLLITEPEEQSKEFEGRDITSFHLKAGLANTSYGPVFWLLFYFPSPSTGEQTTYECVVNPKDEQHLSYFRRLADQKYWHVVIATVEGEVINFFEFPNQYGLSETLQSINEVCVDRQMTDFEAAKSEYQAKFSIDALLKM